MIEEFIIDEQEHYNWVKGHLCLIEPGTAFEDLPDDWKCPRCKQSKEKFNKA